MNLSRLRELSGMLEEAALPVELHFTLTDATNMRKAVDALLEAGLSVDLSLAMGRYFFSFKNESAVNEARKIVTKVIDRKKEDAWNEAN